VYVRGGRFTFRWTPRKGGYVLTTDVREELNGDLFWNIVSISSGKGTELKIERCGRHSPRQVFVRHPDLRSAKVTIRGVSRWMYTGILHFRNPKYGDSGRLGRFTVEVLWPRIRIHSYVPVRKGLMEQIITPLGVAAVLRRTGERVSPFDTIGSGPPKPRPKIENPAWCGCPGTPEKLKPRICEPMISENEVLLHEHARRYRVDEFSELVVYLYMHTEEPFEATCEVPVGK
jgi:hypothetical protein